MIKILLVDGDPVIRRGLQMLLGLRRNWTVVGEAGDGETALALVKELEPDIVLMEIALPQLDGIATMERIGRIAPHCAIVILSLHDDPQTRGRALAAGAKAFVAKHETPKALLAAIQKAAARTSE